MLCTRLAKLANPNPKPIHNPTKLTLTVADYRHFDHVQPRGVLTEPCSKTSFTNMTRSSTTAEVMRVGSHYAIDGHSKSLFLIPIEKPVCDSFPVIAQYL